jgi:ATP-binding protein involved in chromosome partitioning
MANESSMESEVPTENDRQLAERQALQARMSQVKHKILILSGKGGVGKSTVAVNLALSMALAGRKVGLLDIDIHGPSIPKLLNLEGHSVQADDEALLPIFGPKGLKVMSIGFLLQGPDDPVIWRGPLKMGVIQQFLKDVDWGTLDFLIVDSPPGTGDEPLSIIQFLEKADGAVIVTTPQELALTDVRKCINFCHQLSLPVLGVIENMSGFVCPNCGAVVNIFKVGGGEEMAHQMKVPFLGRIPIDPDIVEASDSGKPYIVHFAASATAVAFQKIIEEIQAGCESGEGR